MADALTNSALAFQANRQLADADINNRNSDAGCDGDIDEGPIVAQLNQLRQWQESQRQILLSSQMDQQRLLQWEKEQLYAMLGVNSTNEEIDSPDASQCDDNGAECNDNKNLEHIIDESAIQPDDRRSQQHLAPINHIQLQSPSINQLDKIIANLATNTACQLKSPSINHANIPKRKFLKRGEGLTNRFKIAPDAFRLDKLPKYKYLQRAPKHAQPASQHQDKQRHKSSHAKNDTKSAATDTGEVIKSEGRQRNIGAQSVQPCEATQKTGSNLSARTSRSRTNVSQLKLHATANKQKLVQNSLEKDAKTWESNTNFEQGIFMRFSISRGVENKIFNFFEIYS